MVDLFVSFLIEYFRCGHIHVLMSSLTLTQLQEVEEVQQRKRKCLKHSSGQWLLYKALLSQNSFMTFTLLWYIRNLVCLNHPLEITIINTCNCEMVWWFHFKRSFSNLRNSWVWSTKYIILTDEVNPQLKFFAAVSGRFVKTVRHEKKLVLLLDMLALVRAYKLKQSYNGDCTFQHLCHIKN